MEQKKKLFYLITKSNWGGAQRYVFDLATNFNDKYDITVILGAPREDTIESGKGILLERLKQKKINTITIAELKRDIKTSEEFVVFWKLLKIFWRERPDIVHVNSSKIGGLGSLAARCALIPRIIFTVHGWPFLETRSGIQKSLIRFLSWLSVLFSHKTIVIGSHDYILGTEMFLTNKKFVRIVNGIEPRGSLGRQDTRTILSQHLQDLGLSMPPSDGFWIGTISELVKNKGLEYLINAFKEVRHSHNKAYLFIIGGGEEGKNLEHLIEKNGLVGKVFLLGFVPNASGLLPAFDLVTLTSVKEGLPYVLLEAGCAGLPVLATSVGEVSSIIIDRETGILVPPKDTKSIENSLDLMLSDTIVRNTLAKNLHKHVLENFSLGKMLRETVEVYESK